MPKEIESPKKPVLIQFNNDLPNINLQDYAKERPDSPIRRRTRGARKQKVERSQKSFEPPKTKE